jgi:hypothetical protein
LKNKKYIAAFLLVFSLFVFNAAELFHHHDCAPANEHSSKCQVCIFSNTLKTVLVSEPASDFSSDVAYFLYSIITDEVSPQQTYNLFSGRAPPAFS